MSSPFSSALALALFLIAAATSLALTGLLRPWLIRRGRLDLPDARRSHDRPTPRGGGLAVLGGIGAAAGAAAMAGISLLPLPALFGLALIALVSALDDFRGAGAWLRLAAQVAAIAIALSSLSPQDDIFLGLLPAWADRLLAAVAWLWFVNLYNFMDGIDALATSECIAVAIGIAVIAAVLAIQPAFLPAVAMAGAAAGFLPWNWPRARIFLGDVGSVPMGFLLGYLLIVLASEGALLAALALPSVFLLDATATLLRRMRRGEAFWRPHREHAYQKAAAVIGHGRVSLLVAAANAAILPPALAAILVHPAFALLAFATAGVAVLLMEAVARRAGPGP
jgi:UDP-N-acetylmuramyl pentapeptide phosphotransferase/UDP-N-acetylglucosamine-1-phosphate transferase